MFPVLLKFGDVGIYTYGFFVFLGTALGYWLALREARRANLDVKKFSDLLFWTIISGFLGARILYVIVEWRWFLQQPGIVLFGRSGFVFFGGIISGVIVLFSLARKYQLDLLKVIDIITLHIPLAHALGRIGCFFYGCCYGLGSSSWLSVRFPCDTPAGLAAERLIPIQLISALALLIIFIILKTINRKKGLAGYVSVSYLFLYGMFRFVVEFFRGDPRGFIGMLSVSQWIAIAALVFALYLWRRLKTL